MIRIKGIEYRVSLFGDEDYLSLDKQVSRTGTVNPIGLIDPQNTSIYLHREMHTSRRGEVFVHEVLHGLTFNEARISENMVGRIAEDLYAFLVDNDLLKEGWLENIIDTERVEVGEINDSDSVRAMDRTA